MKHTFTFHGIGCRFESEHMFNVPENERIGKPLNIDMDFGHKDDIWCGIDPWKLFCFIEEYYPDYKKQFDVKAIKEEFDLAVKERKMYKNYILYYFC